VAQVDQHLRTNNLWVTSPSGKKIRLPGQGGMGDVADLHRNFVIYQMSENELSMVPEVSMVSAQRTLLTPEQRIAYGLRPGDCLYISNIGVSRLNFESKKLERILEFKDYQVSPEKLQLLRKRLDPFGVRFLESAKGEERSALIERLITVEEELVSAIFPA
jgi:glutaconate CoA-transferase subunit A